MDLTAGHAVWMGCTVTTKYITRMGCAVTRVEGCAIREAGCAVKYSCVVSDEGGFDYLIWAVGSPSPSNMSPGD